MVVAAPHSSRPRPTRKDTAEDWERLGLRYRLLHGEWEEDGNGRLREFFDESTYQFLPRIVMAFNAFKSFVQETATLFDGDVTVQIRGRPGRAAVAALGLDLLWPQMQEVLELVRGMNDALILREWDNEQGAVRYTPVATSEVEVWADPRDPSQPARVDHYHERDIKGETVCVRDVWDLRDRNTPAFRIEGWVPRDDGSGGKSWNWEDVTTEAMPEVVGLPGQWPYWTEAPVDGALPDTSEPIWPWTAFHWRISKRLVDSHHNQELVDLALVAAVLWTYWTGGLRDVAYQQRYMMDCDIAGASSEQKKQTHAPANALMVMKLVSTGGPGTQGTASQWSAPMDPKAFAESISGFMASGALFAGLSSADVSVSSTGLSRVSGFAIEVSREGKRKVERKIVAPMNVGVVHNLVGAAQLANAYGGTRLPTTRDAFRVAYTYTAQSGEEARAEVEELVALVGAGLLHPADALRRYDTTLDEETAPEKALEIARFKARLAAIAAAPEERNEDDDTATTEADPAVVLPAGAPLAATALNGAQVTSALEIVSSVALGKLPRATAVSMLVEFFQLSTEAANRVLGAVGAGFKPAVEQEQPPQAA
jgi:hypothetical protein